MSLSDAHGRDVAPTLSVLMRVRDEEAMLPGCLRRLDFADQIVAAVDDRTRDKSVEILSGAGALVTMVDFEQAGGFGGLGNVALDAATSDWVFLLDADERVSRELIEEIRRATAGPFDALRVPIANYFHGRLMAYGGWQEHPTRLWRRGVARNTGAIHDRPRFNLETPRVGDLRSPLHHFSHRSVIDNLAKSTNYVEVQARALLESGARPVSSWQLYRTLIREIGFRLVLRQGWRDGVAGVYEAFYWPFSNMCAQARLWELQRDPSTESRYLELEDTTW
jgi:(heptosyl)LPS beta-1,4-glucosyltransferase